MKKTFLYNFIPIKAEEEDSMADCTVFPPSRTLVEIRDLYPPPPPQNYVNPWVIKKRATASSLITGRLILTHLEVFEHIFRYWTLAMVNFVVEGNKAPVVLWDVTDSGFPIRYYCDNIYFAKESNDEFYDLGWRDLALNRHVNPGDELGLFWDINSATFLLKVLRRATWPFNVNA